MAHHVKGSKGHPARISGKQKFLRKLAYDKLNEPKIKRPLDVIDISKPDWK